MTVASFGGAVTQEEEFQILVERGSPVSPGTEKVPIARREQCWWITAFDSVKVETVSLLSTEMQA